MNLKFIDTNILVYAYDADAKAKHKIAQSIIKECWETGSGAISTQVLQEFYVTVTRKLALPLSVKAARDIIQTYQAWSLHSVMLDDILAALDIEERYRLSFWDSLIIAAAQKAGAAILYSEDLQDNQQFGTLKVINPFN